MSTNIRILLPKDWSQDRKGDWFEHFIADIFRARRYKVLQNVSFTGMEVDCLAEGIETRERIYIECKLYKDSYKSEVIAKMIGNAMDLDVDVAYLISTSEPNGYAKGRIEKYAEKNNIIRGLRLVFIGPNDLSDMYLDAKRYVKGEFLLNTLPKTVSQFAGGTTLVITPEQSCWIIEQKSAGVPEKAFIIPCDDLKGTVRDFDGFRTLLTEADLLVGLPLINGYAAQNTKNIAFSTPTKDIVTTVPSSDKFDDYRPARPEDFVGRDDLISELISFLAQIRNGTSDTRLLALSGPSGFGKSSLVLNLAARCRNTRWKNQFYTYPIDTRSAVSPLFVAEAVLSGFKQAINDNFLSYDANQLSIDSVEDPFASNSMRECLHELKQNSRVLILFFDQFEELFIKESLADTFIAFKRLSILVEALQSNVVLGFSWRTGISIPDSHPAITVWQELRDRRYEVKIPPFTEKDANLLVNKLEKEADTKIDKTLRHHLVEQSRYLPWLLKKFCVHVYRKLKMGVGQRELIVSQLDARALFDEDFESIPSDKMKVCLQYIAKNSPADMFDVHEKFTKEITEGLYSRRLITLSGVKYTVYWDIFRDYLVKGFVPEIQSYYIPQAQLSTSLTVFRFIRERGIVDLETIRKAFNYTIKTVWNIVGDLSTFFLIERMPSEQDKVRVIGELLKADDITVADYLTKELTRHVVADYLRTHLPNGLSFDGLEIETIFSELYPKTSNPETIRAYMSRLLPWLEYAGLIEIDEPGFISRPSVEGKGRNKGKVAKRRSVFGDEPRVFVCSASPSRVVDLAVSLLQEPYLSREEVENNSNRNAALDLCALGLAEWDKGRLSATDLLKELSDRGINNGENECRLLIKRTAFESDFLRILMREAEFDWRLSSYETYIRVRDALNKDWQYESIARNVKAGRSWLEYYGYFREKSGQQSLFDVLSVPDANDT